MHSPGNFNCLAMKSSGASARSSNSPVQAKSMEKSRQPLHDQQNRYRQGSESSKYEEEAKASAQAPDAEANVDHHGPEHLRELCREKRAHFRTLSENGALLQFTYKAKAKIKQIPTTMRWERRGTSFSSQVHQDVASNRAESLLGSSLLYSVL